MQANTINHNEISKDLQWTIGIAFVSDQQRGKENQEKKKNRNKNVAAAATTAAERKSACCIHKTVLWDAVRPFFPSKNSEKCSFNTQNSKRN